MTERLCSAKAQQVFNLVVGLAYLGYRALAGWPKLAMARAPVVYGIGGVAAYWLIGRIASLLG